MGSSTAPQHGSSAHQRNVASGLGRPPKPQIVAAAASRLPGDAAGLPLAGGTPLIGDASGALLRSRLEERADELRHVPGLETMHLLVIDEDENVRQAICDVAKVMGFQPHPARNEAAAEDILERRSVDIVLMDLRPQEQGIALLHRMRQSLPRVPIVVMTAFATVTSVVDAMRIGATDCLTKPFALDELTGTLGAAAQRRQFDAESRRLQDCIVREANQRGIIATSASMEKLLRMVAKVAPASHPVLIMGESGTGKELIAKLIHTNSSVSDAPLRSVDCSALAPALLETELFGFVRNEGTGDREERQGLLTQPAGGTLCLEEIGSMPLELQARLLRALQERRLRPVGSAMTLPLTVRLVVSSSRDLNHLVESGQFRRDLYFRLNVVHLRVPPLRERRDDISLLASWFLAKQSERRQLEYRLDSEVLRVLDGYDWPGNVRELESCIERACSISSGPQIFLRDFPTQMQGYRRQLEAETLRVDTRAAGDLRSVKLPVGTVSAPSQAAPVGIVSIAELEKQAILAAIRSLNGDKLMAAKLLGIGKTTLYRKLKEYGLDEDDL